MTEARTRFKCEALLLRVLPEMEARLKGLQGLWPGEHNDRIARWNEDIVKDIKDYLKGVNNDRHYRSTNRKNP